MLPKTFKKEGKCGLLNAQGVEILPAIYDYIFSFVNGFAVVLEGPFLNGNHGVINTEGKVIIPIKHRKIHFFSEGYFLVHKTYEIAAFFDAEGKQVSADIQQRSGDSTSSLKEGLARVETNWSEYVFIDVSGKQAISRKFNSVGLFCDGLARFQEGDNWGYIDKKGNAVVPAKYYYAHDFNEGFAVVSIKTEDNRTIYGYINTEGVEVIKSQYENASRFHRGRALICKHLGNYRYEYFFIDTTGEIVEKIEGYANMDGYNCHVLIEKNNKRGIVSTHNEVLLPLEYDFINHDFCGMRTVKKDGFEGLIDMENQIVVPPIYASVHASSASNIHDEKVRVSCYGDEFYFAQNTVYQTTINVENNGKFGGFPYITNSKMYYTQDFIPVSYSSRSIVDKIGAYYLENGCQFPILDILEILQSDDKKQASFGKDLLKTVNFLLETDQLNGIAIDTNIVLPIAIKWATSSLMNERIMSAHLIKALFLQIKKNKTPLIPLDYKTFNAFKAAIAKKPFALEDVFEIIVLDYGFVNLFYPFTANGEDYKAFVDTDFSVKYLDEDNNTLTKPPKDIDKNLIKTFKELTKTYTALQPIAAQQFAQHKAQCKIWLVQEWKDLFLSNPFYFNFALTLNWQTQNGLQFTLQDDQSMVDVNMEEIEIGEEDTIKLL